MKKIFSVVMVASLLFINASLSHGADRQSALAGSMKVDFTIDSGASLLDVRLTDAKSKAEIKDAKLKAAITTPSKAKKTVDLPGMTMDKAWSYMNSFEMAESGTYSFVITVERKGKANTDFKFQSKVGK